MALVRGIASTISGVAHRNLAQDMLIILEMNSVLTLIFHKVESMVIREERLHLLWQSRQGVNS